MAMVERSTLVAYPTLVAYNHRYAMHQRRRGQIGSGLLKSGTSWLRITEVHDTVSSRASIV